MNIAEYAKAIVAILGAVAAAAMQVFPTNPAVQQWGAIAVALTTAIAVFAVPNADKKDKAQAVTDAMGAGEKVE